VPGTSTLWDATRANTGTFFGAICFFWAARLLIKEEAEALGAEQRGASRASP
jgi:hypothetical protein